MVEAHVIYLYEMRVHPVCEGFLLDSLIFACEGRRERGREKRRRREREGGGRQKRGWGINRR